MMRAEACGTDPLLPRAFSIMRVGDGGEAEVLAKGTGKAATLFSHARPGDLFHLLGPLGNRFPEPSPDRADWLIAGGVGLAPLLMYAEHAAGLGLAGQVTMFYGGRGSVDLVLRDQILAAGVELILASEDGSLGYRGYVTGAVSEALEARPGVSPVLMACGPEPMLQAVARLAHQRELSAHLSLEGEMACGIGACLVCAVPCATRAFRYTCVEGPVFELSELRGAYSPPESPSESRPGEQGA
jgi:dihydroorotate dehydrogenase electron transfer subunit